MQAVILAAGKGTRLHPVTDTLSKAMAPVAGKPIIHRVMEPLIENGIQSFVLVVSPDDTAIRRYFGGPEMNGTRVSFVEQHDRLGMAHALNLAAPNIGGPFILTACDNLVPSTFIRELLDRQKKDPCDALLSLKRVAQERISSVGIVDLASDGSVRRIVEKPAIEEAPSNIGSLPLYLFSRAILDLLPRVQLSARGEFELQDAIQMLIEEKKRVAGLFTESRLQLTNTADLLHLNRHYLGFDDASQIMCAESVGKNTELRSPLRIEEGVAIGHNCTIGPNVILESGCRIGDSVSLADVIVLKNSTIESGRKVTSEVILSRTVHAH